MPRPAPCRVRRIVYVSLSDGKLNTILFINMALQVNRDTYVPYSREDA